MRKKGISLIVLIITIVVIIILATAIIVNIAQKNLIENANETVVKEDFKTMQDELTMYKADKYVEVHGNFKAEDLDIKNKAHIAEIIPSIVGTKYEDYVLIEDGCIAISEDMPEQERKWAMEALGLIKTSTNRPIEPEQPTVDTTAPTEPTNIELTVIGNVITAVASGSTDKNNFVYEYSIDNTTWQENNEFTGLTAGTQYTVYARAKNELGNTSNAINKSITTKYNQIAIDTIVEKSNAIVYGEKPSYNNPIIPVGFKAYETTDATWLDSDNDGKPDGWNNGLVIQDENKNEFVWVPIDEINVTYDKNYTYPCISNITSETISDDADALPNGITNEREQITKYGGFYIGRYEAGVPNKTETPTDTKGIPVVQKNANVWMYISYTNANSNAKSYRNTTNVKSGLVTGIQWDSVCAWIDNEKDSNGNIIHDVKNSVNWGNYNNTTVNAQYDIDGKTKISGSMRTSGKSEKWKAKNIYDLAGNAWEWTGEIYSAKRSVRGGYHLNDGSNYPASYRLYSDTKTTGISFRVVLYIM